MNKPAPSNPFSHATEFELVFAVEPQADDNAVFRAEEQETSYRRTLESLWNAEQPGRFGEVTIILVGSERMRELNRSYRGKDRGTDVLSFDLSDSSDEIEGEIYIGADVARAQAENGGYPVSEELARLMIHGLLHLAGYDHHTPSDGRRMAAATRRWLSAWKEESPPPTTNKEQT